MDRVGGVKGLDHMSVRDRDLKHEIVKGKGGNPCLSAVGDGCTTFCL